MKYNIVNAGGLMKTGPEMFYVYNQNKCGCSWKVMVTGAIENIVKENVAGPCGSGVFV